MNILFPAFVLAIAAALISALAGFLLIRFGFKDVPDGGRKNQAEPMPTAGGVAIFAAAIPMTCLLFLFQPGWVHVPILASLAGGLYMFVMGLWDDVANLSAKPKLLAQLVLSFGVTFLGVRVGFFDAGRHVFELGLIGGVIGSAAWLIVVTNAVNFMDGADGLAMGSSAVIATGMAFLAALSGEYDIAAFAIVLVGALLGHLVWNGRGKLFTGDTGSLFVGFYLGCLALLWVSRTDFSVWLAPLLFIGLLADVLLTLIWRNRNGRNLLKPHREHVYQLMLAAGTSHSLVAWIYAWIAMHGVLIAGVSLLFPRGAAMVGFFILLAILFFLSRKIRNSAIENGLLFPERTQ